MAVSLQSFSTTRNRRRILPNPKKKLYDSNNSSSAISRKLTLDQIVQNILILGLFIWTFFLFSSNVLFSSPATITAETKPTKRVETFPKIIKNIENNAIIQNKSKKEEFSIKAMNNNTQKIINEIMNREFKLPSQKLLHAQDKKPKNLRRIYISPQNTQEQQSTCITKVNNKCTLSEHCTNTNKKPIHYASKILNRPKSLLQTKMKVGGSKDWASGCAISHIYKFIYVHVLKSGGSTIKSFLKQSFPNYFNTDYIQGIACKQAIQKYPEYFIWSFVRNPFSRMYSMYSMATSPSFQNTTNLTFEEFVRSRGQRRYLSKLNPTHYIPQAAFLFNDGICPVFDYVGRLEFFQQDLQTVIQKIGSIEMSNYFNNQSTVKKVNVWGAEKKNASLAGDLRNAFPGDVGEKLKMSIAKEYHVDFILFGYDMNNVPIT